MRTIRILPLAAAVLALSPAASAQTEREHGAHVHGRSQINLAYVDGRLELELEAPGMDIVGFEHVPADEAQREALDRALETFSNAALWLTFEPTGACAVTRVDPHTHGYKTVGEHEDDEHEDDHDHDHAEFHVTLEADCTAVPEALQIGLAERFPAMTLIGVDLITESRQDRIELTPRQTRVVLGR